MLKKDFAHGALHCVLSFLSRLFGIGNLQLERRGKKKKKFEILPCFAKAEGRERAWYVVTTEMNFWGYLQSCAQYQISATDQSGSRKKINIGIHKWRLDLERTGFILDSFSHQKVTSCLNLLSSASPRMRNCLQNAVQAIFAAHQSQGRTSHPLQSLISPCWVWRDPQELLLTGCPIFRQPQLMEINPTHRDQPAGSFSEASHHFCRVLSLLHLSHGHNPISQLEAAPCWRTQNSRPQGVGMWTPKPAVPWDHSRGQSLVVPWTVWTIQNVNLAFSIARFAEPAESEGRRGKVE